MYVCVRAQKKKAGCKEKEDADAMLGFFTGHFSSLVQSISPIGIPSSYTSQVNRIMHLNRSNNVITRVIHVY